MALVTAKATGNWSAGSTWDSDPALPAAGDTVNCAGYTVTVDQNVTVATIKSTSTGYFSVTAARTITAAILSDTGHSGGAVVRCSHSTGTVTITGNVTAGPNVGLSHSGAGTINVTGNAQGGSGASAYAINNTSTGTINLTGNGVAGSASGARAVHNNSTGTIAVTGNITGGSVATGFTSGAYNAAGGTITISGDCTGGSSANAHGAHNNSTGTLSVDGVVYPGSNVQTAGLYGANSGGTTTYKKASIGGAAGVALLGYVKLVVSGTINVLTVKRSDTGADYELSNDYPAIADVKSGTVYKLGTLTGTYSAGGLLTHPGMSGGARG
jgi:hypothetical protein